MIAFLRRPLALAGPSLALTLAACGGGGGAPPATVATKPAPATPAAQADAIFERLQAGDTRAARRQLAAALKRDPMNPSLLVLRDSIDGDPQQLLGPQSFPYTVQAGDTISGLAQSRLGNRLKAYQLARYNNLAAPFALTPGQVIRIPGEPPRPVESVTPRPAIAKPKPAAPSPTRAAVAKPSVAAPAANPAAARQARAGGLAALNQGRIGPAVALLRRAVALDPANPLAARDLARAERIAATVRTRQ